MCAPFGGTLARDFDPTMTRRSPLRISPWRGLASTSVHICFEQANLRRANPEIRYRTQEVTEEVSVRVGLSSAY